MRAGSGYKDIKRTVFALPLARPVVEIFLEILALIVAGLQNAEIARRLFISPKTIDHHISAVLAKLNARSRTEAIAAAYQLDIVS